MIFDIFKNKKKQIDFSKRNIDELLEITNSINNILNGNELEFHANYLLNIGIAAKTNNETEFKNLIISRELFGGSGALWEIYIKNEIEYNKFRKLFLEYIKLINKMGIKNSRIEQIKKIIPKLR